MITIPLAVIGLVLFLMHTKAEEKRLYDSMQKEYEREEREKLERKLRDAEDRAREKQAILDERDTIKKTWSTEVIGPPADNSKWYS